MKLFRRSPIQFSLDQGNQEIGLNHQTAHPITRAGHFLTKVRNSSGAVWISFTFASSSTKKKELGLYLHSRPRGQTSEIYKGNVKKYKGQNVNFSFFAFLLIKLDQKQFSASYIRMFDQGGSFDTHIDIFCDILWPS